MPDGGVRVSVALTDPMLDPSPSWTQLDSSTVASVSIQRGRQDEFNRTGTGTAEVVFNDRAGDFDPTNSGSPYFGNMDGRQAKVELYDPVAEAWETQFRGFIDDGRGDAHPSQFLNAHTLQLVDGFDYLARAEVAPGIAGTTPPTGSEGNVFYEDANVDDRIIEVLADSLWPSALSVVFSGNVSVQESIYDPGASFLSIIADAADAEFPDVANIYMDRIGRFHFHGRFSRFDPEGTAAGATPGAWDFHRWSVGDGAAIISDQDTVQIRGLSWARPMQFVYNTALAWPKLPAGGTEPDLADYVATAPASQADWGIRPWSATDLIVLEGTTSGLDMYSECVTFANYIVTNYSQPVTRVSRLVFRSMRPDDPRAEANWELLTKIDVSDIVELTTTNPGGGGFEAAPFFVEGVSYDITPLTGDYADVTLQLDVSPVGYYTAFT
jgi:hypothetical protein